MAADNVDFYVENIARAWLACSWRQTRRAFTWYPTAHEIAGLVGHGNYVVGSGIIAALSPQKDWYHNIGLAMQASEGVFAGQVGNALDKARRIWDGEDPRDVLPMDKKTGQFFLNILDPDDPEPVTIDRHAYRVATCEWDNGQPKIGAVAYREISEANRIVGRMAGVPACVVQAGTWCYARER